jgi:hypothetical protein
MSVSQPFVYTSLNNPSQCSTYHSNTAPETLEIALLILLSGVTCRGLVCEQTVLHRNSLAVESTSCMQHTDGIQIGAAHILTSNPAEELIFHTFSIRFAAQAVHRCARGCTVSARLRCGVSQTPLHSDIFDSRGRRGRVFGPCGEVLHTLK